MSVVTLAASLAGIVLSPKLGSWKYLLLFCTTAGFSCGAQAKMTLPMEIFGTKERSSIGPIMAFGWSTSGNDHHCKVCMKKVNEIFQDFMIFRRGSGFFISSVNTTKKCQNINDLISKDFYTWPHRIYFVTGLSVQSLHSHLYGFLLLLTGSLFQNQVAGYTAEIEVKKH